MGDHLSLFFLPPSPRPSLENELFISHLALCVFFCAAHHSRHRTLMEMSQAPPIPISIPIPQAGRLPPTVRAELRPPRAGILRFGQSRNPPMTASHRSPLRARRTARACNNVLRDRHRSRSLAGHCEVCALCGLPFQAAPQGNLQYVPSPLSFPGCPRSVRPMQCQCRYYCHLAFATSAPLGLLALFSR